MSSKKNVLVVGDGIMAWNVLYELQKNNSLALFQYANNEAFPACSDSSTAINCLRGTTRGVSPLGDMIVDAFDSFEAFLVENQPDGVAKGYEYQIFDRVDKWKGRYPDYKNIRESHLDNLVAEMSHYQKNNAYFFDIKTLRKWFEKKNSSITKKKVTVFKVDANGVVHSSLGTEKFDHVVVCLNYNSSVVYGLNDKIDYYIDHCKPVAGSYLELSDFDCSYFNESTNLAFEAYHLIFRKDENKLQIGATTDNRTSHHLPNENGLITIYNEIKKHSSINLPKYDEFKQKVGVRYKGYKRMPLCEFITNEVCLITGMYKNGYVLPFLFSKKLCEKIC